MLSSSRLAGLALAAWLIAPAIGVAHRIDHDQPQAGHAHDEVFVVEHGTAPERVRALIDHYHRSGDDHLLERGWEILSPALGAEARDPATLLAAAWLAQAGHDFTRAQSYLHHVLALRPGHGEAWLLRASVAMVQGDVEVAREACGRTALSVPVVVTAACFSQVDAYDADQATTARAYRRLASVLAAQQPADGGLLGWLQGVAADLAGRAGLETEAAEHFRVALQLTPTVTVRAGYADLLLATGQPARVLELIEADDTAPALALRRVIARSRLGEGPDAARLADIDARFARWIAADDMRHAREMALFYLHVQPQPLLAFELAQRNFEAQREPEDRALLCAAGALSDKPVKVRCDDHAARLPMIRAVSSRHGG